MDQLQRQLSQLDIRLSFSAEIVSTRAGYSVHALAPISSTTRVASAPKAAVLSPRTSALAPHIPTLPPQLSTPTLALATAVLVEILRGADSPWSIYLDHLPPDVSTVAGIWHEDGIPMTWCRGTELERELERIQLSRVRPLSSQHLPTMSSLRARQSSLSALYTSAVLPFLLPILPPSSSEPTLDGFLASYAFCTSRAFLLDTYHRLALVPLFDLFNHSTDGPHVHLESHEWVCAVCGNWDWCEHEGECDGEELQSVRAKGTKQDDDEDERIELVAHADVEAGAEIFNTYGEALSNARLAVEYGFVVEANPWDVSLFSSQELGISWEGTQMELVEESLVGKLVQKGGVDSDGALTAPSDGGVAEGFFFDADAKVSVRLWTALALRYVGPGQDFLRVYEALELCWDEAQTRDLEESPPPSTPLDEVSRSSLASISRHIVLIARARRTGPKVHQPDLTPSQLLLLADVRIPLFLLFYKRYNSH